MGTSLVEKLKTSMKYQKKPKLKCNTCGFAGLADVGKDGKATVRAHANERKRCSGSGSDGRLVDPTEWTIYQANYRLASRNCCGTCAHRKRWRHATKDMGIICDLLQMPVDSNHICKHHKAS